MSLSISHLPGEEDPAEGGAPPAGHLCGLVQVHPPAEPGPGHPVSVILLSALVLGLVFSREPLPRAFWTFSRPQMLSSNRQFRESLWRVVPPLQLIGWQYEGVTEFYLYLFMIVTLVVLSCVAFVLYGICDPELFDKTTHLITGCVSFLAVLL